MFRMFWDRKAAGGVFGKCFFMSLRMVMVMVVLAANLISGGSDYNKKIL